MRGYLNIWSKLIYFCLSSVLSIFVFHVLSSIIGWIYLNIKAAILKLLEQDIEIILYDLGQAKITQAIIVELERKKLIIWNSSKIDICSLKDT